MLLKAVTINERRRGCGVFASTKNSCMCIFSMLFTKGNTIDLMSLICILVVDRKKNNNTLVLLYSGCVLCAEPLFGVSVRNIVGEQLKEWAKLSFQHTICLFSVVVADVVVVDFIVLWVISYASHQSIVQSLDSNKKMANVLAINTEGKLTFESFDWVEWKSQLYTQSSKCTSMTDDTFQFHKFLCHFRITLFSRLKTHKIHFICFPMRKIPH